MVKKQTPQNRDSVSKIPSKTLFLREYKLSDKEEVVFMYYEATKEVLLNHEIKPLQNFNDVITNWEEWGYDIIVTENGLELTGFSVCCIDTMGGIVEPYYHAEVIFVKPEYRKGRSAYLLYQQGLSKAQEKGMLVATNAYEHSEASQISKKLGVKTYTHYERKVR